MSGETPQFNRVRVAADADAAAGILKAVLLVGFGGAATIKIYDATSATGTSVFELAAVSGGSTFVDMTRLGGIKFTTGMYVDITGTNALCLLWKG
jgi:hypothetical protein